MRLDILWNLDPAGLWESEWIRRLLSEFELKEVVAPALPTGDNPVLLIARTGSHPLTAISPQVISAVERFPRKGIFHISDEYLSGGYQVYGKFDFVIRSYWSRLFNNPGILTVPLGLTSGMAHSGPMPRASERQYAWSFSGNLSMGRVPMLREMAQVEPHRTHRYDILAAAGDSARLSKQEFKAMLLASKFIPCAMGQRVSETFRVFEALEHGCIPLVERRGRFRYYDELMPGHPMPTFSSWRQAASFAGALAADPARLDRLQAAHVAWWGDYKSRLPAEVGRFVRQRLASPAAAPLRDDWRPLPPMLHRMWRLVELARHHSPEVLALKARRRVARSVGGLPRS